MPEHFHLLIVPSSGTKISWIMQEIKKGSARLINKDRFCRAQGRARLPNETPFLKNPGTLGRPRPRVNLASDYSGSSPTPNNNSTRYSGSSLTPKKVWMDEYYDYVIRNEEDLIRHLQYIYNNPVKRGLVETTEQYLWSSVNTNFENDLENTLSGSGTSPTTF